VRFDFSTSVEELANANYRIKDDEDSVRLREFIFETLVEFSEGKNKTNTAMTKMRQFHEHIERKLTGTTQIRRDAWFLTFMHLWYRQRHDIKKSRWDQKKKNPDDEKIEAIFHNTINNNWEGQVKHGEKSDILLQYVITHPRLSINPYFTIPVRLDYIRRIRTYERVDKSVLSDCNSQIKIINSEIGKLSQISKNLKVNCSIYPCRQIELACELFEMLTKARTASYLSIDKIKASRKSIIQSRDKSDEEHENIKQSNMNEHEKLLEKNFLMWFIFWSHVCEYRIALKTMRESEQKNAYDELKLHVRKVGKGDGELGEYLTSLVKRSEEYDNNPRKEMFDYLENVWNIFEEGPESKRKKGPIPDDLVNSILRRKKGETLGALNFKSPKLGKNLVSAEKFCWRNEEESVEDKTRTSLMNDCRDSIQLALFLLESIRLDADLRLNRHVSLVIWDLMFKIWYFLSPPTFWKDGNKLRINASQKIQQGSNKSPRDKQIQTIDYVRDKGLDLAKELRENILIVLDKAELVIDSQYGIKPLEKENVLREILRFWKNCIEQQFKEEKINKIEDVTSLGELRDRCGSLIGKCRTESDEYDNFLSRNEKCILFFTRDEEDMLKSPLIYTSELNPKPGQVAIDVGPFGESATQK